MRRAFLSSALLVGGLFVVACTEQRSPLPTEAPSLDLSSLECDVTRIDQLVTALFPAGTPLDGARKKVASIRQKMNEGKVADAQQKVFDLLKTTLADLANHKLLNTSGTLGLTTPQAVSELFNRLFVCVNLAPPGDVTPALDVTGGAAVIGSNGGRFTTGEAQPLAGLVVPAGAVSSDHLFTIARRNDLTPRGQPSQCLGTSTVEQVPLCYDYSVFPATTFNPPVTLVICQLEAGSPYTSDLALAHRAPSGNGIEILPVVGDPFPLTCTGAVLAASKGLFNRLTAFAMKLVTPKALYAGHTGLGGSTCCYSTFIAVHTKLDFVQQPTNTAARATITPPVRVAIENFTTGEVVPDVINPIRVAIGTNPAQPTPGTLSGTLTQSPSSGVATFGNLSIDKEAAGYTLKAEALAAFGAPPPPTPVSATSVPFNIGNSILIYGASMSAPTQALPNNEQTLAEAAGYSVTVADAGTWSSFGTADFARFNAIVFGDPSCTRDPSPVATADGNKATWSPAVHGPVVVIGTDPQLHSSEQSQARQLITNGINFAARGSGTGLYVSLSCYYFSVSAATPVNFLSQFGDFEVIGQGSGGSCPAMVTIVAPGHPVMAGLSDAGLSNWSCSVHEFFEGFPSAFTVLANGVRPENSATLPYIIARSP